MSRGLFIGRFQPIHIGHITAITNALKIVDELIIVIGTSNKNIDLNNPFTTGERIEIVRKAV